MVVSAAAWERHRTCVRVRTYVRVLLVLVVDVELKPPNFDGQPQPHPTTCDTCTSIRRGVLNQERSRVGNSGPRVWQTGRARTQNRPDTRCDTMERAGRGKGHGRQGPSVVQRFFANLMGGGPHSAQRATSFTFRRRAMMTPSGRPRTKSARGPRVVLLTLRRTAQ